MALSEVKRKKKGLSVKDLMINPPPTRNYWKKWSRTLSKEEREMLAVIRGNLKKDLKKKGILLEITVQPVESEEDNGWGDQQWDLFMEKYEEKGNIFDDFSFILTDFLLVDTHFKSWREGKYFQHNILAKDKASVNRIFKKHFGSRFDWNGSSKDALHVKLTN